ncbi:uncharacterized protein LOC144008148 isoform X3 [Festucalex cinctus]
MQRITVDRQPHLCLFATKDIEPGEETTYNYGDFDFPWRLKVSTEAQPHDETAVTDCAKVDQISTEEQPDEAGVTDFTKADQKSHQSALKVEQCTQIGCSAFENPEPRTWTWTETAQRVRHSTGRSS